MPHLDAKALTDDPQGMEFLAKVVGAPSAAAGPVAHISVPDEALIVQPVAEVLADLPAPSRGRRRKTITLVPEAA
jgi:hypothetical protein